MYTVTTSLISPEGMPDVNAEKSPFRDFERAADCFVRHCEDLMGVTPMVVEKKNYKESNGKWCVTLEKTK